MTETPLTRRNLLHSGVVAGAAVGLAVAGTGGLASIAHAAAAASAPRKGTPSDLEILNFALSLEHLESAFYSQVLGAHRQHAFLNDRFLKLTEQLAANEASHVDALSKAVTAAGGTPVAPATYKFPSNVFVSTTAYSWFAWTLEEIGIGAYLGAIGSIKSNALRKAAASIYGSETRHAAILRSLGGFTFAPHYFESPLTIEQVQGLIAPYTA